jgi:YesN/AraC family two-component response regulator
MKEEKIYIKNMVCPRCIKVIKDELFKAGFEVPSIELGSAIIKREKPDKKLLKQILTENGFELLEEKTARLINEMKLFIIDYIRNGKIQDDNVKLSSRLENHFGKDYGYLSHMFSTSENTTLEKFIISQKIELIKEWLVFDELSLSEMSWKMGYKNVSYLSNQFKQITGFSPSQFKRLKDHKRRSLDDL